MKRFMFQGQSDDTFGEYGITYDDYDNCANGKPIVYRIDAEDGSLLVVGQFARSPAGGWLIGVAPTDTEGLNNPTWPIAIEFTKGHYTPTLTVDAPDDARLTCVTRQGHNDA